MKKLFCLLIAVMSLGGVVAQITTSSLRGVVKNSSDETLVGATVALLHPESGRTYAVYTDAEGYYAIHGIRPAENYRLEVSYVGYQSSGIESLALRVGDVRTENIILKSNTSIEPIAVVGRRGSSGAVGEKYNESLISQMPTVSRSLYDVVRLTPQAVVQKGGGVSYGGVASRYNTFMINGMANNDMYGLSSSGTNGGLSNANPVALDAIEQLEVVVASYDVRMSGFGGGAVNAITKSGTNNFKGTAYTYYHNQDFYGTTPGRDLQERTKLQDQAARTHGFTFGGPIVKNKLFFFVSGEYNLNTSPSSYYLGYDGVNIDKDDLNRISARYKTLTGYDGGGVGRRDVQQKSASLLANLDWNINTRHNLSLSYSYLDARAEEYANSLNSFMFNGSGYANYSNAHYLGLSLESRLTDKIHNTLRVGYSRVGDGREPDVVGALPSVIIKNTGKNKGVTVNIGNNRYAGVNNLKQNVVTLSDDLIVDLGAHSLMFGMHHELYNIHNQYIANAYGTYTYNSIEEFERDMAAMYEYNYTDPAVTGTTTWGPRFKASELNFYAQDSWQLGGGFQLMYGLRATLPLIFNTPTPNEEFNARGIASKYNVRIGDVPQAQLLLSPRVGFSWSKSYGDSRLMVDGGAGIFTGQVPFVWIVNNYSNTGVEQKGLRLVGRGEGGEIVESAAQFTSTPSPTTMSNTTQMLNAMNSKFRYPQNFKANISAEIATRDGWNVGVEVLYTKTLHNAVFRNIAIEPMGEEVYAVMANGAVPKFEKSIKDYSAVYYLDNTSKGYSYSVAGNVSKSFDFGLSLAASYIFSRAYSVCDVPSTSSSSNWNRTYGLDLNNLPLSVSSYDIPHKVSFVATYAKRYAPLFDVSASLVYQLISGQRYSLCFGETVDFNGDGVFGSTLMYIPTEADLAQMRFADGGSAQKWNEYIEQSRYLRKNRGSFAERNAMQAPVEHSIDLHLAHGFYFGAASSRKIELSIDIMNLGNMICRHWGMRYNVGGGRMQPVTVAALEDGEPVYRFTSGQLTPDDLLSRWHMQLGVRVVF